MTSAPGVYFFSFLLAFCSLFYELAYAEVLSVCLGGTKVQYITTIALFTCALGFGSLFFRRISQSKGLRRTFFTAELLLMFLGALGPFFITWVLQPGGIPWLYPVKVGLSYALIFSIGFISGLELPSLFALRPNAEGKILAMDYLGMLSASVTFPLLFLPNLGTAASTLLIALLNGSALLWLREKRSSPILTGLSFLTLLGLGVLVITQRAELNGLLSALYLGGV